MLGLAALHYVEASLCRAMGLSDSLAMLGSVVTLVSLGLAEEVAERNITNRISLFFAAFLLSLVPFVYEDEGHNLNVVVSWMSAVFAIGSFLSLIWAVMLRERR